LPHKCPSGKHPLFACAVFGVACAAPPTRPFPRPGRGRQEAGHSPVGSDVSWTLGSPAVRSPGTTIGSAASYEQPASILVYWAAPSLPDAVGARNGSQRIQTPPAPARRGQTLLAGEGLPARLSPTVTDTPEFPDTKRSLVQIQYGPPGKTKKSNSSNRLWGPFRGPKVFETSSRSFRRGHPYLLTPRSESELRYGGCLTGTPVITVGLKMPAEGCSLTLARRPAPRLCSSQRSTPR
jgi:hypothetical protein